MELSKPIPEEISQLGLESICVEHWQDSTRVENEINAKLAGTSYRFRSHWIMERDSCGPVTSLLRLWNTETQETIEKLI